MNLTVGAPYLRKLIELRSGLGLALLLKRQPLIKLFKIYLDPD